MDIMNEYTKYKLWMDNLVIFEAIQQYLIKAFVITRHDWRKSQYGLGIYAALDWICATEADINR